MITIAQDNQVNGFKEAVFSVYDLKKETQFYEQIAGWKVIDKSKNQTNKAWGEYIYDEVLLKNDGDESGFLRLVKFKNVSQKVMRSGAKSWDYGGHFDIDVRVKDLEKKKTQMQQYGWMAFGLTERYQFGKFDVSEVLMQDANGIVIAMIQRHSPPLEGWNNLREFSFIFNSAQIVKDIEKSGEFYAKIGFKQYMKSYTKGRGDNILGIPKSIDPQTEHRVVIMHPEGKNTGSVEPIQIEGLGGDDYSENCVAPNLGILSLRFPVKNIDGYSKQLRDKFVKIEVEPTEMQLKPYGKVKLMQIKSPDGAILEFFEVL
jgi:catechol 2,3-dioxygenase-like lactoylglutathione lyase family enzyme